MSNHITKQGVLFKGLSKKRWWRDSTRNRPVQMAAVLLKACDERLD